jgi:hydrogenase maturation factor
MGILGPVARSNYKEGVEIAVLDRIVQSMAQTCQEGGLKIVAGDTKEL